MHCFVVSRITVSVATLFAAFEEHLRQASSVGHKWFPLSLHGRQLRALARRRADRLDRVLQGAGRPVLWVALLV